MQHKVTTRERRKSLEKNGKFKATKKKGNEKLVKHIFSNIEGIKKQNLFLSDTKR